MLGTCMTSETGQTWALGDAVRYVDYVGYNGHGRHRRLGRLVITRMRTSPIRMALGDT